MKKNSFFYLAIIAVLSSCNQEGNTGKIFDVESEIQTINLSGKDTILTSANGMKIFLTNLPNQYCGQTKIEISGAFDLYSQMAYSLSTVSSEGILQTQGMFKVSVYDSSNTLLNCDIYILFDSFDSLSYDLYSLDSQTVWKYNNTLCNDLSVVAYDAFSLDTVMYYNYVKLNDGLQRMDSFLIENISICDIPNYQSHIGNSYLINFASRSSKICVSSIQRVYNFTESDSVNFEYVYDLLNSNKIEIIPAIEFSDNNKLPSYATQGFSIEFNPVELMTRQKLDSLYNKVCPEKRMTLINQSLRKINNNEWVNLDRLKISNEDLLVKIRLENITNEDIVYVVFEDFTSNVKLNFKKGSTEVMEKLPLDIPLRIVTVGLRNGLPAIFISERKVFMSLNETIVCEMYETTVSDIRAKIEELDK